MQIRVMTPQDYDGVYTLWKSIKGFAIRSVDDSREGIEAFLIRNPTTSVVAIDRGIVVGSILCGNDGRYGYMYHVCVHENYRRHGIGNQMVDYCINALRQERINKIALITFSSNDVGNAFWQCMGWKQRGDINYYDLTLNETNIITINL